MNFGEIAIRVQGSVANGPSAALYAEVTDRNERMVELNFHNYRNLRLAVMRPAWCRPCRKASYSQGRYEEPIGTKFKCKWDRPVLAVIRHSPTPLR